MTALSSYSTGTASVAADSTAVTGSGPLWNTTGNVKPGDLFQSGHFLAQITDVVDDTHLTITPWPGSTLSGASYVVWKVSQQRIVGETYARDVDKLVGALNTSGFFVFVDAAATVPDPSLGDDGQYAFQPTTGKMWVKSAGVWTYLGVYKAFQLTGAYDNARTYAYGDVQTTSGSSYIYINDTPSAGHTAPNTTYWQLLASKGDTGATPLLPVAAWLTATAYVAGPPASYVTNGGSSYMCLVSHTSGTFATDLAAGKWGLVAQKGTDGTNGTNGASYGGTSTTSLTIGTGSKAFTTQSGLAYQNGARVRATATAGTAGWVEGVATYSGTTLTITSDKTSGSGTGTAWNLNIVGQPGAGDLSSANNLSDLANVATARANLGLTESIVTATVGQLPGTTGTTQPAAGKIGERISATGSASLTSATAANVASITPTAGVWDLEMVNAFNGPGATTSSDWTTVISTANASTVSGVVGEGYHTRMPSGADMSIVHSSRRIRVTTAGSTPYYLNAQATYSGASYSCSGTIQATRVS
ncbi:hypothetical protein [Bradyrhizobium sp. STM 3561]|uniref:hypothetical protein n=1 Tax=Bradyrhizobium sp. STM 3561 TaxID=578923 RepID=UPI0038905F3B